MHAYSLTRLLKSRTTTKQKFKMQQQKQTKTIQNVWENGGHGESSGIRTPIFIISNQLRLHHQVFSLHFIHPVIFVQGRAVLMKPLLSLAKDQLRSVMTVLNHYHSLSLVSDLLILSRRAWQIVAFEVRHQSRVILVVHFFFFFFAGKNNIIRL